MKRDSQFTEEVCVRRGILEWLLVLKFIHFDQNFNGGTIGDEFKRRRAVKVKEGKQSTQKVLS